MSKLTRIVIAVIVCGAVLAIMREARNDALRARAIDRIVDAQRAPARSAEAIRPRDESGVSRRHRAQTNQQ